MVLTSALNLGTYLIARQQLKIYIFSTHTHTHTHTHTLYSAGNTALTYACCGGYEEVVRLLLDAGAEVEHQNENGHTPLMEAASCGHVGKYTNLYIGVRL